MSSLAGGSARDIPVDRAPCSIARGLGPRAALRRSGLREMQQGEKKQWVEAARLNAILGNSSASLRSLRSGVCCYITFAGAIACLCCCVLLARSGLALTDSCQLGSKHYFPPSLETLLAWSTLFRCKDTFSNYLNYVRTGCLLVKASVQVRRAADGLSACTLDCYAYRSSSIQR